MARVRVDTKAAKAKVDAELKRVERFTLITTEEAARYYAERIREEVPVRSGRLRDAIVVRRARRSPSKFQVRIQAFRFPRFFYPIMMFDLWRALSVKHSPKVLQLMRSKFASRWNRQPPRRS